MSTEAKPASESGVAQLSLGVVANAPQPGLAQVRFGDDRDLVECQVVEPGEGVALRLQPGDRVVVWRPGSGGPAVVIGRLGKLAASGTKAARPAKDANAPDELVLEARKSLVLRVGDGSITIREDGRILIKGKDLVSHAERMNRIKGGAVAIN
jgi:hypothetical protein